MATITRKTAPKAIPAKSANEVATSEAVEKESSEIETVAAPERKRKEFKADDGIPCVSIVSGELGMEGVKSKINYRWAERGDITEVEYQDLVAAVRSNTSYIVKPYFIISDPDFVAQFPQLNKIYESMYSIKDLREVLDLPIEEMAATITALPEGAKESIKNMAASAITYGNLDSIAKVKVLDEIFDTKLMLLTELFNA